MATGQRAHGVEKRFLYDVISTVGSSLDLDEMLDGVLKLLCDASATYACLEAR